MLINSDALVERDFSKKCIKFCIEKALKKLKG